MDYKAKAIVEICAAAGCKISLSYAREWMTRSGGDSNAISRACIHDIQTRMFSLVLKETRGNTYQNVIGEALLKDSGRVPFKSEQYAAQHILRRSERDIILGYLDKDERLLKDLEAHVSSPILRSDIIRNFRH